jgi:hypothetical protein
MKIQGDESPSKRQKTGEEETEERRGEENKVNKQEKKEEQKLVNDAVLADQQAEARSKVSRGLSE